MKNISGVATLFLMGCGGHGAVQQSELPVTEPARLCVEPTTRPCRSVRDVEALLRAPELRVLDSTDTPGGQQGAKIFTLLTKEGISLRAKWRDSRTAGPLNVLSDARREVVAYALQSLFLKPEEFVVPPTVGHCFPLKELRKFEPEVSQTWPEASCVFGYLSYWLPGVETVYKANVGDADHNERPILTGGALYSAERFEADSLYARKVARFNVFSFVLSHGDSHRDQFLVPVDDPFHVWSVDHSISLTSLKNPKTLFEEDWSRLLVPAIPAPVAARLRALQRSDIDHLTVIERYQAEGDRLIPIRAPTAIVSAPSEADIELVWNGRRLEVGTTLRERELIWSKLSELQAKLNLGELGEFED